MQAKRCDIEYSTAACPYTAYNYNLSNEQQQQQLGKSNMFLGKLQKAHLLDTVHRNLISSLYAPCVRQKKAAVSVVRCYMT